MSLQRAISGSRRQIASGWLQCTFVKNFDSSVQICLILHLHALKIAWLPGVNPLDPMPRYLGEGYRRPGWKAAVFKGRSSAVTQHYQNSVFWYFPVTYHQFLQPSISFRGQSIFFHGQSKNAVIANFFENFPKFFFNRKPTFCTCALFCQQNFRFRFGKLYQPTSLCIIAYFRFGKLYQPTSLCIGASIAARFRFSQAWPMVSSRSSNESVISPQFPRSQVTKTDDLFFSR